jgi:hypothetical protein
VQSVGVKIFPYYFWLNFLPLPAEDSNMANIKDKGKWILGPYAVFTTSFNFSWIIMVQ